MILDFSSISNILMEYGLSRKEADVYVYVASCGPCKAIEIAGTLDIPRTEVYRILANLQHMGVLEATLQRPARFAATPVSKALERLIDIQKHKAVLLENRKSELLEKWKALEITPSFEVKERFQVLEGLGTIYSKAIEVAQKVEEEIILIGAEKDFARAYHEDLIELLAKLKKKGVSIRLLTEVSEKTKEMLKDVPIQVKYANVVDPIFPHFIVADGSELILFIKSTKPSGKESALWTNSETLLHTMRGLFDQIWKTALPFHEIVYARRSIKGRDVQAELTTKEFKDQLRRVAFVLGFMVEENYEVVGSSGVSHVFDLAVTGMGTKPVLIDTDFSDSQNSMISVISFFAKKLDSQESASDFVLVINNIKPTAFELSNLYGIRIAEFIENRIIVPKSNESIVSS